MQTVLKSGLAVLALQLLAFHSVWRWYAHRLTDGSDEPWGLLALVTGLILLVTERRGRERESESLLIPALLTILFAVTYPFSPKPVQAALAVVSVAFTLALVQPGAWLPREPRCRERDDLEGGSAPLTPHPRRLPENAAPILGLCLLSVPLMPSLQFYAGYPLRVASGMPAAWLLQMSGLAVSQDGACLRWGGEPVVIDAACSGVRMLWVGLYLAFTIAAVLRLGSGRTIVTAAGALVAVILGNAIRSASLFHLETGIVNMPSWSHEAVGVIVFAFTGIAIAWFAHRMARRPQCATQRSS